MRGIVCIATYNTFITKEVFKIMISISIGLFITLCVFGFFGIIAFLVVIFDIIFSTIDYCKYKKTVKNYENLFSDDNKGE